MFSYLLKFRDNITFGEVIPKRAHSPRNLRAQPRGSQGSHALRWRLLLSVNFCKCCNSAISWLTQLTYPRRNRRYSLSQMILALVCPLVLGLDRLETASFLRSNGTFQYLTASAKLPNPQTLRRFLLQAPDSFLRQMHRVNDRLLQNFIHIPDHRSRLIFDLDSSVVTVFGRQERAESRLQPPLSRQTFVQSAPVHRSQLFLSLGYRTASRQRRHMQDGSVELMATCFLNVPRDIPEIRVASSRCRLWVPSGVGNSRSSGR